MDADNRQFGAADFLAVTAGNGDIDLSGLGSEFPRNVDFDGFRVRRGRRRRSRCSNTGKERRLSRPSRRGGARWGRARPCRLPPAPGDSVASRVWQHPEHHRGTAFENFQPGVGSRRCSRRVRVFGRLFWCAAGDAVIIGVPPAARRRAVRETLFQEGYFAVILPEPASTLRVISDFPLYASTSHAAPPSLPPAARSTSTIGPYP
jgi:hypothetical protein